jgi:hypothetical protein
MDVVTAGPIIEGCDDFWEEIAIALAVRSQESAAALARRSELRHEITSLKKMLPGQRQQLAAAEADHAATVEAFNALAKPPYFVPISALAGLMSAGLTFGVLNGQLLLAVPAAVVIVAYAFYIVIWQRQRSQSAAAVQTSAEAVVPLATEVQSTADRLEGCELELAGIDPKRTVSALGRCFLSAEVRNLGGYAVLLDRSGVVPSKDLTLADMTYDSSELSELVANIDELRDPPVLLDPSHSATDNVEQLHGQERRLRQTVERFSHFVDAIPVVQQTLSLLPRGSGLARRASTLRPCVEGVFGPILSGSLRDETHDQAIAALQRAIQWSRSRGHSAKQELLSAYAAIQDLLSEYRGLRTVSVQQLHTHQSSLRDCSH